MYQRREGRKESTKAYKAPGTDSVAMHEDELHSEERWSHETTARGKAGAGHTWKKWNN